MIYSWPIVQLSVMDHLVVLIFLSKVETILRRLNTSIQIYLYVLCVHGYWCINTYISVRKY